MPKTADSPPPVLVDAEPGANGFTTWHAGGPGTEKLNGRILFSSPAVAVEAIANALPDRQVLFCPATPQDRREAEETAAAAPGASVGAYPVWIEERRGHAITWAIHWPRKPKGMRHTTSAATLAIARRKIRNRKPQAGLRVIVSTEKGRAEVAALPTNANTLVREHLAPHVV